jgi:hypothetical protein
MTCTRIVLLGAEKNGQDAHSNFQRTNELRSELLALGLSFVGVSNVSSDKKSQLFMVQTSDESSLVEIAARYEQKAILVMDSEKKDTEVVSTKSKGRKQLGRMVQVNKDVAVKQRFYLTFVEDGKEYFYITKGVEHEQGTRNGIQNTHHRSP